ncbi:hypothetical protein MFRU_002g03330 [Monilinia fructicola]|uniref:DUF4440 domain-containing protein n=1 Tax=Monilinia fructicola TaxID=38448 RepID=A0A5M9K3L1_MONFR|nr:hypothetical protein EYC84_004260 [Monilinia fructicola]KAG4034984.1 hypothetical protein MFRU_002g03330 [Monilinia fructicola]
MSFILEPSSEAYRERKAKKQRSQPQPQGQQLQTQSPASPPNTPPSMSMQQQQQNGGQLAHNFQPQFKQAQQPDTKKPRYKGGNYGPGTISQRIEKAMYDLEHQTWRCRLDKPSALLEYIDPKAVFASPEYGILTNDSEPTLKATLEDDDMRTWNSYEIKDMKIVEVSMMAATVVYDVTASITDETGAQKGIYKAYCTSCWKQEASADWKLCTYTEAPHP